MFTGIIKNTGVINKISRDKNDCSLEILSRIKFSKHEIGSSISCSGVCLTLDKFSKKKIKFYLSKETLIKTNFKSCKIGDIINLEKSLKFGDRVSGHFVQGHVDTTCNVEKVNLVGKSWLINFKLPKKYRRFLVEKASVTINGVSLTISKITKNVFQIMAIPKTLKLTNLMYLKKNDLVNVECDILAKYMKSYAK